jgi:hypothetical protein
MPTLSVRELEEALRIRRKINVLKTRLANLLTGRAPARPPVLVGAVGRKKLSTAVKARWAKRLQKRSPATFQH